MTIFRKSLWHIFIAVVLLFILLFSAGCESNTDKHSNEYSETDKITGWEPISETDQENITSFAGTSNDENLSESISTEGSTISTTETADGTSDQQKTDYFDELNDQLLSKLSDFPGIWSLYFCDMDSGENFTINNEPMTAASLIKLFVAGAYYDAVQQGIIADDYRALIDIMISKSDNDACNRLIDILGKERINSFCESNGYSYSTLNRKMLEQNGTENYTSAKDCGIVLERILNGTFVNEDASLILLNDLKAQERTSKIPAGVPSGVVTANKTGELASTENDAAIIFSENGTYILCVMSDKVPSAADARSRIVELSKEVYSFVSEIPKTSSQPVSKDNGYTVVIDAGHQKVGDSDKEAIGPGAETMKAKVSSGTCGIKTKVPEYELNLNVALKLQKELTDRGYNVIMTRTTNDVNISNRQRAEVANNANADAFIRIHANGSADSTVNGAMTICQSASNPYNGDVASKSKALSTCVLDELVAETGCKKEYVWETDTMSGINWSKVPVTIVEMGYMTNPDEDSLLEREDYQIKIVEGIANGIDDYLSINN